MTKRSLRIDLLKSLLLPLAAAIALMVLGATAAIYHEVQEIYDITLAQYARIISDTSPADIKEDAMPAPRQKHARKISYRVFENSIPVLQSSNASNTPAGTLPAGFSNQEIGGKTWRMYVYEDGRGKRVEVAERYALRHEIAFQLLLSLFLPALCFTALTIVFFWRGITSGLKRLTMLSGQVDARQAQDLSPIDGDQVPREVSPLVDALNRLFQRLGDSFMRERQFTDNAAHELRTPLAAIKTQAQVIARTEKLSATGQAQLDNLLQATERAANMTQSLLTFSRLENEKVTFAPVDMSQIVSEETGGLRMEADRKSISLAVEIDQPALTCGVRDALSVLVRNLIQNAIRYTGKGGEVRITLKTGENGIDFTVQDNGPGIPDHHKQKVFERFYRINKAEASGAGLGLSMAAWVAGLHGTEVRLEDAKPAGLIASIHLPPISGG